MIVQFLALTFSIGLACCAKYGNDPQIRSGQPGNDPQAKPARCHDNMVHTTHGDVRGQTKNVRVSNGGQVPVDVFWGIPYAKPPVGDRRFRPPVSCDPWNGVLQATTPPNSCTQVLRNDTAPYARLLSPVSEDCLYLNVWRPRCGDPPRKLTTMVWIHGEFFTFDSSVTQLYNGENLAASECVIVVSMNYRLGAFGFLYLEVPESPGNMGLLDVTLAVKWVNDNVANFGGDPGSITLFGSSYGGDIVALLLLSPLSQNLFSKAIIQSGTPFSRFIHQSTQSALKSTSELARILNCSSESQTAVVSCLKGLDPEAIALGHAMMMSSFMNMMVAVTDGHFLTQDPQTAFDKGDFKRCDLLVGSARDEGTYGLAHIDSVAYNFRRSQPPNLNMQELNVTATAILSLSFAPAVIPRILEESQDLYKYNKLRQQQEDNLSFVYLKNLVTDLFYICPTRRLATIYAKTTRKVYLYFFKHARDVTTLPEWVGATHTIETAFVFGTTTPDFPDFSPREVKLGRAVRKMWANFAKFGNPTPGSSETPKWPRYGTPDLEDMLVITESANIRVGRTDNRPCAYWAGLPSEFFIE